MKKIIFSAIILVIFAGCGKKEMRYFEKVEFEPVGSRIHVLSITAKGPQMLIGTYGKGAYFSVDSGENWRNFTSDNQHPDSGLSWDFIMGGVWQGDYLILATLGDGINISSDSGRSWKRFGYNFFGVEYLYSVGIVWSDSKIYVPTADGIVVFDFFPTSAGGIDSLSYNVIDERAGLSSQYLYDLVVEGDRLFVGSLNGFSFSEDGGKTWRNFSPNGRWNENGVALCKVRAVAAKNNAWYAGCDDGLYVSVDSGKSWENITSGLPSPFVHDIHIDGDGRLWVATYKGLALSTDSGKSYQIFDRSSGFFSDNVNCVASGPDGRVFAGTNYGLYRIADRLAETESFPSPKQVFDRPEEPAHQWFLRPVAPEFNDQKDQTYLYGMTMGGNFRQHQGCEFNNPEGVPLRAVDDGTIVYVRADIGHSVLRCDRKLGDNFVYVHYHHQCDIIKQVGQKVNRGDIIGHIGKLGNVTNEHLHFEVSLSSVDDSNVPNKTVNNELWIEPLPGCGTIVGNVVDRQARNILKIRIYGVEKPVPTETPFSFAETYGDSVSPSPVYGENFAIADVPAGKYVLWVEHGDQKYAVKAEVEAGMITRTKIIVE